MSLDTSTLDQPLGEDDIVAEVRRTRERLAAEAGNDFVRLWTRWEVLEAAQRTAGRAVITTPTNKRCTLGRRARLVAECAMAR